MTKEEWKKNDALLKIALKTMGLFFFRDQNSWEAKVFTSKSKKYECDCYSANNGDLILEGPNTPESLGEIKTFLAFEPNRENCFIDNIFFGVTNYEELKIKLDLMT